MATRFSLTPEAASFPASAYPGLMYVNRRPVLAYDASTEETAYWTFVAPQGLTGTLTAVIYYIMASATSGNVLIGVAIEATSPGDTNYDLDAAASFDTTNLSAASAVPGTAGHSQAISVTLTNNDSMAAGDYVRLAVFRDADNAGDTATGDLYLLAVEFRDAA